MSENLVIISLLFVVMAVFYCFTLFFTRDTLGSEASSSQGVQYGVRHSRNPKNPRLFQRTVNEATVNLYLEQILDRVAFGEHVLKVEVTKHCEAPKFSVRVAGDALVYVRMVEQSKQNWFGTFEVPNNGSYYLDMRWYGCSPKQSEFQTLKDPVHFQVDSHLQQTNWSSTRIPPYFPESSAWMRTKSIPALSSNNDLPSHMWSNVKTDPLVGHLLRTTSAGKGFVLTESTLRHPDDYFSFTDVSNYELVCQTMHDIWKAFLDLRGQIFPHQRPFKFHYYNASTLVRPDRDWDDESKKRLRKCKHLLVSIDETNEPVSQSRYMEQINTFAEHAVKVLHGDKTFPIWFFSLIEPPMRTANCHGPWTLPRTTDHPCNEVLRNLFLGPANAHMPPNVHFLDNTDLSLPQFEENRADILAVIAHRVFIIVGKGVAEWRRIGQRGEIDGLHRNGTVEPNFVLEPYVGW